MKFARHAPLALAALFAIRVAACGGGGSSGGGKGGGGASGTAGAAGSVGTSAICVSGDISYAVGEGQAQTHSCPNHDCWIDASTGSAACMFPGAANVKPFRTCRTAADCSGATYCETWGPSSSSQIVLGSPTCVDGACDWAAQTAQACPGGQLCYPTTCSAGSGTTSGGFPWTGNGGSTGATGGSTGATGGSTGTVEPAATCDANGDIKYTAGGIAYTHICRSRDCWVDAATGSASCRNEGMPGVKPFRTCRTAADCSGATYCNAFGDAFEMRLGSPACVDSVCDWAAETQQSCTGTYLCYPTGCAYIQTTTSGGFPWGGCPASGCCGGGGGCWGGSGGTGGGTGGATGTGGAPADGAAAN